MTNLRGYKNKVELKYLACYERDKWSKLKQS